MNIQGPELWIRDHREQLSKEVRKLHQLDTIHKKSKLKQNRLNRYKNFLLSRFVL